MARVGTCKGPHSFTCTPTRLSANGMNHALPSQPKLVLTYRPRRDGRLSRLGWLVTYLDGLSVRRRSPISCTNRARCSLTSFIKPKNLTTNVRRKKKKKKRLMGFNDLRVPQSIDDSYRHIVCRLLCEIYVIVTPRTHSMWNSLTGACVTDHRPTASQ